MKKLLLLSALFIFACSSDLFAQDYMKLSKKKLRIEHRKKVDLIDSLNSINIKLESHILGLNKDLNVKNQAIKKANKDITYFKDSLKQTNLMFNEKFSENRHLKLQIDSLKVLLNATNSLNRDIIIGKYFKFTFLDKNDVNNAKHSDGFPRDGYTDSNGFSYELYGEIQSDSRLNTNYLRRYRISRFMEVDSEDAYVSVVYLHYNNGDEYIAKIDTDVKINKQGELVINLIHFVSDDDTNEEKKAYPDVVKINNQECYNELYIIDLDSENKCNNGRDFKLRGGPTEEFNLCAG
jgi:hypothetical protein